MPMTVFLGLMLPLVVEVAKRLSVNPFPHVELSSTDVIGLIAVYSGGFQSGSLGRPQKVGEKMQIKGEKMQINNRIDFCSSSSSLIKYNLQ